MDFPTYTPYRQQKILHEGSSQQSPREPESPQEAWKLYNEVQRQSYTISDQINATHRQLVSMRNPELYGVDFYPFKIYQFPSVFRSVVDSNGPDWLKVRVRSGNVLTSTIDPVTCSLVIGTDGIQICDYQIYPAEFPTGSEGPGISGSLDILVDSGSAFFWLWVESSGSNSQCSQSYYLRYSSTPSSSSYGNPNPWSSFPQPDGNHTVIGYVDGFTGYAQGRIFIRQYQRTDINQNSISANSGPTHYVTAQIFGDYYKCYTYAGTIISGSYQIGSTPVWVAKPPELRHSVANELIENTQVTYSYASRAYNADGQRTATVGGSSITQTEIIQPVYHVSSSIAGDSKFSEIWADMPSGGTGCTGSTEAGGAGTGSLLIWMDTNRSARKWNWVS